MLDLTRLKLATAIAIGILPFYSQAQSARINVDAAKVTNTIPRQLYGSCIEDVNHEIYGGLYDQRLFGESFEEPKPGSRFTGWKTLGGQWTNIPNGVRVGSGDGYKLVRQAAHSANGTISTQIKFNTPTGTAGLIVRVSNERMGADSFSGYEIGLDPGKSTMLLGKHRDNWNLIKEEKVSFDRSEWNTIKVQLDGPRIRVFLNNDTKPVIDHTDPLPLLEGKIGLRTYAAGAEFQNVTINGDKLTFSALPSLDLSGMWDDINSTKNGELKIDDNKAYTGKQSQSIAHNGGAGKIGITNKGLNRWGIGVRKGQLFSGRVYISPQNVGIPVTVALQNAGGTVTYASQTFRVSKNGWNKYNFSLSSNTTDPKARFALYLTQKGKIWVDQAVLMSTGKDQFKGYPFRADIANKMQQQGLNFLRYGGTMVNAPEYRWKKMVGDRDKRQPYKGHWYPYSSNGFGIEEFIQLCEAANFEPAVAINIEETPEDVVDMLEYLKGDVSTPWGKKRAENGHPKPYRFNYLEIGNEEILFNLKDEAQYKHYVGRFNILHDAVKRTDANIKLINAVWWRPESKFSEYIFKELNGKADYWDLHVGGDNPRSGDEVDRDLTTMKKLWLQWDPNTKMKVAIFEENGGTHGQARALGHATNLNAVRKHGDFVLTSCPANALQALGQNDNGWDQGQIFFTPSQVWGMPPFYSQQMAAVNHLPLRVSSEADHGLDVSATRSEDGKTLILHIVNPAEKAISTDLQLAGFDKAKSTVQVTVLAAGLQEVNTLAQPAKVSPKRTTAQITGNQMAYTFAPSSYTILKFGR